MPWHRGLGSMAKWRMPWHDGLGSAVERRMPRHQGLGSAVERRMPRHQGLGARWGAPMGRGKRNGETTTLDIQPNLGRVRAAWEPDQACSVRGSSSAGRAPRSQCGGQGFDPPLLHFISSKDR